MGSEMYKSLYDKRVECLEINEGNYGETSCLCTIYAQDEIDVNLLFTFRHSQRIVQQTVLACRFFPSFIQLYKSLTPPHIAFTLGNLKLFAPSLPIASLSEKYSTVIVLPTISSGFSAYLSLSSAENPDPMETGWPLCSIQTLERASYSPKTPLIARRIVFVSADLTMYSASCHFLNFRTSDLSLSQLSLIL